jgi:uncharacterized protein DUF3332
MRRSWIASRKLRAIVAGVVIGGYLPLATVGCFGNFSLTRKVYGYNEDVSSDKWVRWLVFLIFNFIPVYGFAAMFDAIFANSIEFWTGDNPVAAGAATERVVRGPNGEIGLATFVAPGVVDLELTDAGGNTHQMRIVREEDAIAAYDRDGHFLVRVGDRNGAADVLARGIE